MKYLVQIDHEITYLTMVEASSEDEAGALAYENFMKCPIDPSFKKIACNVDIGHVEKAMNYIKKEGGKT